MALQPMAQLNRGHISTRMTHSLNHLLKLRDWSAVGVAIVGAFQIVLLYPFFAQTISEMPKPWEVDPGGFPADNRLQEIVYPKATMNRVFGSMLLGPIFLILFLLAYWPWRKARSLKL